MYTSALKCRRKSFIDAYVDVSIDIASGVSGAGARPDSRDEITTTAPSLLDQVNIGCKPSQSYLYQDVHYPV